MNVGDRVRLLRGNEEGVVTKISSSGRVEIEIEDGFRIPAMRNEVVVISDVERQHFGDQKSIAETDKIGKAGPNVSKEAGLFLAYIPINDKDLSVQVINNTKRDYLVLVNEINGDNSHTILASKIFTGSAQKVTDKTNASFEDWPTLVVQFFPIHQRIEKTQPTYERKIKFKAASFFRSKGTAPVLNKTGYIFKLSEQPQEIDIVKLNEELSSESSKPAPTFQKPAKEIDLHIEKLTSDHAKMSNNAMLKLQVETFEKNINYAIASGMDEITFIHGIGNGILRKEIHKYLSQLVNIKYFQDTQKNRFGYGATLVRIS